LTAYPGIDEYPNEIVHAAVAKDIYEFLKKQQLLKPAE
jgi:hypothetical protein